MFKPIIATLVFTAIFVWDRWDEINTGNLYDTDTLFIAWAIIWGNWLAK